MIDKVIHQQIGLVSLKFIVENDGIKLIYDQIDTPLADMYIITHIVVSIYILNE